MTRHSKNATAGPTYTYHEKNKDSRQSGYGTKDVRLSKDAIKEFDCCSLTLQPCKMPIITPDGWIYEKEAILEYILHKKRENAKQMKLYEKQKNQSEQELKELAEIQQQEKLEKFLKAEGKLVKVDSHQDTTKPSSSSSKSESSTPASSSSSSTVSNMSGDLSKRLSSFWVPSLCPASDTKTKMKKPDTTVCCPMSNKPISLKDLIDVKFKLFEDKETPNGSASASSLIQKKDRYVCALSNDILNNSVPCVVLKTSGAVVTAEVVEKIIKKDMIDPINGKKMTDSDFIPIQRGGTGYAGSGVRLNSKVATPAMIC